MRKSFFAALGVAAVSCVLTRPTLGCKVDKFQIINGLDPSGNAVVGQQIDFKVWFELPVVNHQIYRGVERGSLKMNFGDGDVQDTGLKTFDPPMTWDFGLPASITFSHRYPRAGTFTASLTGGSVQPCGTSAGLSYQIPVVGNLAAGQPNLPLPDAPAQHSRVTGSSKRAATPTPATFATGKGGSYQELKKVVPGQITAATVSYTPLGNTLSVDGSGHCGLRAFETMNGSPLRTYDFTGPLPTMIKLLNTTPGIHVVKIEGDKSLQSCGGTASASAAYAKH